MELADPDAPVNSSTGEVRAEGEAAPPGPVARTLPLPSSVGLRVKVAPLSVSAEEPQAVKRTMNTARNRKAKGLFICCTLWVKMIIINRFYYKSEGTLYGKA
jgi:hypothetical protein